MLRNLVLLALALTASAFYFPNSQPLVSTQLGSYRGFEYTTKGGSLAHVYLGIPYVKPPVGNLRFEKPVPIGRHNDVFNATKFGYICHPHTNLAVPTGFTASEDCLFLNIVKPANAFPGKKLPVLVWIHGGGYEIGSSNLFGYTGFADNYIPQDIIVVTIQYRLGIYGYLSTGDSDLPGNYGSWDQVEAIRWLYKNIDGFGGNPKKITAWGLSAGGCAAAELVLSTQSRNMIAGAIEMSGSAFSYWGVGTTTVDNSLEYINEISCTNSDGTRMTGAALKTCLKGKSVAEIYQGVNDIGYTVPFGLDTIKWGPVIDGPGGFLEDSPYILAKTAPRKPVIVGAGDKDTGYFGVLGYSPFIQNMSIPIPSQGNFTRDVLESWIRSLIRPGWFGANHDQAVNAMVGRYAPPGQSVGDSIAQYLRWTNEIYFYKPTVEGILARREKQWPIWAYEFEQFNQIIYQVRGMNYQQAWGSVHTNEYAYMFDLFNMGPYQMNGTVDGKVHDQLVAAIGSFTKYGRPIIPGKQWPQVGCNMDYYVFKGDGEVKNGYFMDSYYFIKSLDDLGFDMGFLTATANVKRN